MYNDFGKVLESFEMGGENKPPKWGPRKRAIRQMKKNCGKPGCSRKGKGLV
jgi:hypothetical protein